MPGRAEMPLAPFQQYVSRLVDLHGIGTVAQTIGVDEARIRCVLRGTYHSKGKRRTMHGVTLPLVDRWVTAFGDHYLALYPEILDDVILDADYLAVAA